MTSGNVVVPVQLEEVQKRSGQSPMRKNTATSAVRTAALLTARNHRTGQIEILAAAQEPHVYKYRPLWRRAVFKIKVRQAMKKVNEDILVYGTTNELTDLNQQYKANIDDLIDRKVRTAERFRQFTTEGYDEHLVYSCLIHPNSSFKKAWNSVLILIMLYTAVVTPYRVAFMEQQFWDWWTVMDVVMDALFCTDIGINFFSISQNEDGTYEVERGTIAAKYVKTWFVVDVISCFPMTMVDYFSRPSNAQVTPSGKYNSLLRIAKLPRLYKLLRIVRIIKLLKSFTQNPAFERFQDFLQINSRNS